MDETRAILERLREACEKLKTPKRCTSMKIAEWTAIEEAKLLCDAAVPVLVEVVEILLEGIQEFRGMMEGEIADSLERRVSDALAPLGKDTADG